MKNNTEQFEEARLVKGLSESLRGLNEIDCPLNFSDLELPKNGDMKWKPILIAASVLFSVSFLLSQFQYNNRHASNYQAHVLNLLIEESQELENELLLLKEKKPSKSTSFNLIKTFQEIEKIDIQLEKIYSSQNDFPEKEASVYWKQRIEKLNFALQLMNLDKKPLYI